MSEAKKCPHCGHALGLFNFCDCSARVQLDMNAVAAQALAPKVRGWYLEYDCSGMNFRARVDARSMGEADAKARADLSASAAAFRSADAHMVVCLEVRS